MIKPAIPADEFRRLETLRALQLLDTPPEERFDRVTRLARNIFGTPIALVSIVDADRQWFKSRQGLDATETPRDISFCGHAILDDRVMVVNDATSDERFCDNPLVCGDPNIRFYAGYPISAPDGSRIGTLCIIDNEPREISKEERGLLRELGRMVEEELIAASMVRNDPVTGLSNRLGFCMVADHLLKFCERNENPASALVFHFANMQAIEDMHGHAEGDRAACEFAHLLMSSFRDSDVIGRVGLDEFAVLLAGSNLDGLDKSNHRLQDLIRAHNSDDQCAYDMDIAFQSAAYQKGRHVDMAALLQEVEDRFTSEADDEVSAA